MDTTITLPAAVVFDCDGTLVETESLSDRTWRTVLGRRGYEVTDADLAAVIGRHWDVVFGYFSERVGGIDDPVVFRREIRDVFVALFDDELVRFDDAIGMVRELHARGIPVAVASSSSSKHIARVLEVCGIDGCVSASFGADQTDDHKPHPAPYLAAAEALGVSPEECVAVEDSQVGIASAVAAGMFTVAVRRGHVPDAHLAEAHRITDHLTLADLTR